MGLNNHRYDGLPQDSPVEQLRKTLPRGEWTGTAASAVYRKLAHAAERMGANRNTHLSDLHIETMAIMGTGHEETMKAHLHLLRVYGWLDDLEKRP